MTRTEVKELFLQSLRSNGVNAVEVTDVEGLRTAVAELSADCLPVYCPCRTETETALTFRPDAITPHYADAEATIEEMPAAIAETGTLISWSRDGIVMPVNLLPPRHIALISSDHIFADLNEFFASLTGPMPTNITLITGPSRTADIEQKLITGVHGPQRLDVVVYE